MTNLLGIIFSHDPAALKPKVIEHRLHTLQVKLDTAKHQLESKRQVFPQHIPFVSLF